MERVTGRQALDLSFREEGSRRGEDVFAKAGSARRPAGPFQKKGHGHGGGGLDRDVLADRGGEEGRFRPDRIEARPETGDRVPAGFIGRCRDFLFDVFAFERDRDSGDGRTAGGENPAPEEAGVVGGGRERRGRKRSGKR